MRNTHRSNEDHAEGLYVADVPDGFWFRKSAWFSYWWHRWVRCRLGRHWKMTVSDVPGEVDHYWCPYCSREWQP